MSDTPPRKRLPRGKRVPPDERPPMKLTERDIDVIQAVNDHRALLGSHIEALFFGSQSTAQYRLSRLFQHEYLDRHFMSVVSGGPASSPILYTLGNRGEQVLIEHRDYDDKALRRPRGGVLAAQFLEHLLKINDFRIAVNLATQAHEWQVETWEDETFFRANPDYVMLEDKRGRTNKKPVYPDGYFRLVVPQGRAHFFLEVDRSREGHKKFQPQIEVYQAYTAGGQYQARYSQHSLRILVVTTSWQRVANLKKTTAQAGGDRKYWFTTFDQVSPETILTAPVWQRLDSDDLRPLIGVAQASKEPGSEYD
ncbi:MAG: hypothetical protein GX573_01335 [Chloroflexi bacterium]|nr:hypothetical protein [Chloroflexota bacterium]